MLKRISIFLLVLLLIVGGLAGCAKTESKDPETPQEPEPTWAKYDASGDAAFLPKDVFSSASYVTGLSLADGFINATGNAADGVFLLEAQWGKCYEFKIPAGTPRVKVFRFTSDPRTMEVGESQTCTVVKDTAETASGVNFMYTCRVEWGEYVAIETGASTPFYIGERSIIAEADTADAWYIPEMVGSLLEDGAWGDLAWSAEEFVDNLYEPLRARYPDYITRTDIGKDASGEYTMYCYEYAPKDYKSTIFLAGGIHSDEGVGYFSLAKIMQLIAEAKPEDTLLYTLRQNVRFVVIPIINVWGVSNGHPRANSNGQDLNRDFIDLSQQESKNVIACFEKYAETVDVAMDFHISQNSSNELWFNFINYSDNAVVNFKTTNHLYHRYLELGYTDKITGLGKLPGSYVKGSQYLEGVLWNRFGVPTITVEMTTNWRTPREYSADGMTIAVETYINFIIQNALFFLQ